MKKTTLFLFLGYCALVSGAASAKNQATPADITARQFDNISFVQTRIADNKTGYDRIIKALAKQYGSGNARDLPIDPVAAELSRLLQSIRSHCAYCAMLHEKAARDLHIPQAKIDALPAWRESQLFTPAEKAALNYTEALSDLDQKHIQQAHEAMVANFTPEATETLMMSIVNMDAWIRVFLAQGKQPRFTQ
ncbi:carboxymuconolactone decarboxylase family protein [Klebsiella aerogenes]|uniref:carboxymuconolactone decarboxylase family protein n=1 Tax=Klebsiella aerogenes TaxID=548 RepID=UPI001F28D95E|nr:carboxymuconolactone decarboxylase family protein [Klebsiella aerogenes]